MSLVPNFQTCYFSAPMRIFFFVLISLLTLSCGKNEAPSNQPISSPTPSPAPVTPEGNKPQENRPQPSPVENRKKTELEGSWTEFCAGAPRAGRYVVHFAKQRLSFYGDHFYRTTEYFSDERCESPMSDKMKKEEKGTFELNQAPTTIDDKFTKTIPWVRELHLVIEGKDTYTLVGVKGKRLYEGITASGSRDFYSRALDPDSEFRKE